MSNADLGFIIPSRTGLQSYFAGLKLINSLLAMGLPVVWISRPFVVRTDAFPRGHTYQTGDFLILINRDSSGTRDRFFTKQIARRRGVVIHALLEQCDPVGYLLSAPKIAVYRGSGTWDCYLWYTECLRDMGFAHDCLTPSQISSGKLRGYDVYVQPGGDETWQAAALWPGGRDEIRTFLESGGNYIGSCGGLDVAGDADGAPLGSPQTVQTKFLNLVKYDCPRNLRRDDYPHDEWARKYFYHIDFNRYSQVTPVALGTRIPIRVRDRNSPVLFNYEEIISPGILYGAGPIAKDLSYPMRSVADFAPELMELDSPWMMPPEEAVRLLDGAAAIATAAFGKGKLVFFAPHPENPRNPEHFRLVANSLFYLTADGPDEVHKLKNAHTGISAPIKGKAASKGDFDRVQRELIETKDMCQRFIAGWSRFQSLESWSYKHVPEWLLKLPGYSRIRIPSLELETLRKHIETLSDMVFQLKTMQFAPIAESTDQRDHYLVEAAGLVSNTVLSMPNRLKIIRRGLEEAVVRLDDLEPHVDVIVKLRGRVDCFKQPSAASDELRGTWATLDLRQSQLNDAIWRDMMFYLDGKAEVSMYSVWRAGILGMESSGILPELGEMTDTMSQALVMFERALVPVEV